MPCVSEEPTRGQRLPISAPVREESIVDPENWTTS
jgi:hypothetical protein